MVKGQRIANENLKFLALALKNLMQHIIMSYEAPFRSNLKKKTLVQSSLDQSLFHITSPTNFFISGESL